MRDKMKKIPILLSFPSQGRQQFTKWSYSYTKSNQIYSKTFYINCEKKLSMIEKLVLHNFQTKYLYHAIDDALYLFKSKSIERKNILSILYSPVVYLQNHLSVDFFDIWIGEISINEVSKVNKFLTKNTSIPESVSSITIKLLYNKKRPSQKRKSLW